MDIKIIVAGLLLVILIIAVIVLIFLRKSNKEVITYDIHAITVLLDKNNIRKIDFIRNKIVIDFINIDLFNPEELQKSGAKGMSIVGDKIKFYIEGTNDQTYNLYLQLKQYIEG